MQAYADDLKPRDLTAQERRDAAGDPRILQMPRPRAAAIRDINGDAAFSKS